MKEEGEEKASKSMPTSRDLCFRSPYGIFYVHMYTKQERKKWKEGRKEEKTRQAWAGKSSAGASREEKDTDKHPCSGRTYKTSNAVQVDHSEGKVPEMPGR